jgi:signal transduction histidine kinase/phage shock protein PspC (stress-responsive transcriptional regulator)
MASGTSVPPAADAAAGEAARIDGEAPSRRRAYRDTEEGVVGGVAAGLAENLRVPVLAVRVGFVVLALLSGFGVALYAALWVFMPRKPELDEDTPGGESATRGGRRPRRRRRLADMGPVIALVVFGFGIVLTVEAIFGRGAFFWPLFVAVVGISLLWRQADEAQRERWLDAGGRIDPIRMIVGSGGWASWVRMGMGLVLLVAAFVLFALRGASVGDVGRLTIALLIGVAGIGIVVGPWVLRLVNDLSDEHAERVRSQDRADVAAHLHDSVLQTLALIQRNADDPAVVTRLARAQERDLRAWLYEKPADGDSLAGALREAAAELEDAHAVHVDVVVVGDRVLDDCVRPIVAAAREAMANATRHSGAARVDVYAEVEDASVEVFVRDRGSGFVLDDVPDDRHGVRNSILDRMDRHGGTADIRSTPGEGTEVHLRQPLEAGRVS